MHKKWLRRPPDKPGYYWYLDAETGFPILVFWDTLGTCNYFNSYKGKGFAPHADAWWNPIREPEVPDDFLQN